MKFRVIRQTEVFRFGRPIFLARLAQRAAGSQPAAHGLCGCAFNNVTLSHRGIAYHNDAEKSSINLSNTQKRSEKNEKEWN